jgi:hypothetical protein
MKPEIIEKVKYKNTVNLERTVFNTQSDIQNHKKKKKRLNIKPLLIKQKSVNHTHVQLGLHVP